MLSNITRAFYFSFTEFNAVRLKIHARPFKTVSLKILKIDQHAKWLLKLFFKMTFFGIGSFNWRFISCHRFTISWYVHEYPKDISNPLTSFAGHVRAGTPDARANKSLKTIVEFLRTAKCVSRGY